jgi:hypothetical protein
MAKARMELLWVAMVVVDWAEAVGKRVASLVLSGYCMVRLMVDRVVVMAAVEVVAKAKLVMDMLEKVAGVAVVVQ